MTVLIFSLAMILNYGMDYFRVNSIISTIQEQEIMYESYLAEEEFVETFGGEKCDAMQRNIESLKQEMKEVGVDLSNYGRLSFFKKGDYSYLERKYFLLELKFLASIEKLNRECGKPYVPILFFYEADNDESERQAYILSEISDIYKHQVVVLSIDKDYEDEPLINLLLFQYNVTKTPTTIIAGEVKYEDIVYANEIKRLIEKLLEDSDFYGSEQDFGFVLDRTGQNREEFVKNLSLAYETTESNFAKGDINLVIGRLTKNSTKICEAVGFYEKSMPQTPEEKAIIYETIASLGCKRNKKALFSEASKQWRESGNDFRANLDLGLASGGDITLEFSTTPISAPRKVKSDNVSSITIGSSSIELTEKDVLVSQADRVSRDWLSYQIGSSPFSKNLLTVFSERLTYTDEELLPEIGWHEGARIKELASIGLTHIIASGTVVAKKDDIWYAPDEKGVFRFEVPIDKVLYPTTRFLREDLAVIVDTHGINMIVEQAVRNNATVVVGCCDNPGKIEAAKYLSEKNIKVICFTDKYLPILLGTNHTVLGSPPIRRENSSIILGRQPITFSTKEKIVAEDVGDYAKVQSYYDTPARYFRALEKMADLNVEYVSLDEMNSTDKVTKKAEETGATMIGVRIFNSDDYRKVKEWLEKDINNKAVLFHSTAYPYGYKLINEFPQQTTFDDINPQLI
ncbi:hypothetical protein JW707_03760 [Candidatus Woesearchaeota archaeon]|nr:hypothetical protein [Candidatus Woesearchaeota archaeon]